MAWKHTAYRADKFGIGHLRLKQKLKENTRTAFVSPPKNRDEKEKEKKATTQTIAKIFTLQANAKSIRN